MTYRLRVGREAKADIRRAARWYEGEWVGLGRAFVQQIDALFDRVRFNPRQYQTVYQNVRRAIARRFPYGVFYRIDGADISTAIPPPGRIEGRPERAELGIRRRAVASRRAGAAVE